MINTDLRQIRKEDLIKDLHNYYFVLHKQGKLVTFDKYLKDDVLLGTHEKENTERGRVSKKFSKQSAFRLKQLLLKTKIDECYKNSFSLTLTFPVFIQDLSIARNILKRFGEWLKRKYNFGIVWKQEFTKKVAYIFI